MVARGFLTEQGKSGCGPAENETYRQAMPFKHDILLSAARAGLDVVMLSGSLRKELRDVFYKQETGVAFADSLREVLHAGGNVRILVYNKFVAGLISPQIYELLGENASAREKQGKFEIHVSGTLYRTENVSHFLLAYRKGSRWVVRVEQPHKVRTANEHLLADCVRAAISFDTDEALEIGEPLLETFNAMFDAAAGKTTIYRSLWRRGQALRGYWAGYADFPKSVLIDEPSLRGSEDLRAAFEAASKPNWDGEGAASANPLSYEYAKAFLKVLSPSIPIPDFDVDSDGELCLEWDDGPRSVFSVSIGPDGTLTYAGLFGVNKTHGVETFTDSIPASIESNILRARAST